MTDTTFANPPALATADHGAWPAHHPVARLPGSLPMGGVVPMTPVHAFTQTPAPLRWTSQVARTVHRTDIALGGLLAFTLDDVASADECDALVAASERCGWRDEAPGIATPPGMRMNKAVHWVADEALLGPLMARIRPLLPATLGGEPLFEQLSHRLNLYRYDDADVFNRHTDGAWPGYSLSEDRRQMLQWPDSLRSGMTMLLYLNGPADGVQGGHTRLFRRDGGTVDVCPKKGSALFFRHGFGADSVVHEGCVVHGTVPKFVARINVMYGRA